VLPILMIITVRDGLIVHSRDYSSPVAGAIALGRMPELRQALMSARQGDYDKLDIMTVRSFHCKAAAAVATLSFGAALVTASTANAGTTPAKPPTSKASAATTKTTTKAASSPLPAKLQNLGLSVYDTRGIIAGEGAAAIVARACTTLGTKDHYGAIAVYTGKGETGTGVILFSGDNAVPGTEYGVKGITEVNFQNCTNQIWEIGQPGHAPVDQQAPGTDGSTRPEDWAIQEGHHRVLGTP
jgi:hypothetical protein